ncbi:MAG: adenylosuccinate synthase [Fuerstiella sp.]|nr:adenylosuccinate synthase [Fuerstiella sp.]MCP4507139.1 adenylosuccinate synthase [Fuerstiella sp.]MDG2128296.1 adenylosuccinate synthase [Fuerstiella sp.]
MPATSVIGLQWGDEAKGKIVDLLTEQHEIVIRYQGGNNAGHTVKFDGKTYKLSLLPTGILQDHVKSVIGPGVVIDPRAFLKELDALIAGGEDCADRMMISDRAHVICPWHLLEEAALEASRGGSAIGTTMRGIGTCYREKAGRFHAIRIGDLIQKDAFVEKVREIVPFKQKVLNAINPDGAQMDSDQIIDEYSACADRLRPMVADTTTYLLDALEGGKKLLFEGAQGSLLDIDHGTFPYVTSSNSSGCGIQSGSGVPARAIGHMIGVAKAYTTRVGGGPFPTELDNQIGQRIRDAGNEYGTVTGRPRRCGWLDTVATRYSARISGVDTVVIALLDVLSGFEELNICEAYDVNGKVTRDLPSRCEDLAVAIPVLRRIEGWSEDITGVRRFEDLPAAAQEYVRVAADLIGRPVSIVSVGPDREQTIHVES